jgi:hypothetical protein
MLIEPLLSNRLFQLVPDTGNMGEVYEAKDDQT